MGFIDKLESATEKIKRKTKSKKADKRARQRRIELGEPEGGYEAMIVGSQDAKELGGSVTEFVESNMPDTGGLKSGLGDVGEGAESVVDDTQSGDLDLFDGDPVEGEKRESVDSFEFDDIGSTDLDMDLDDL